MKILNGLNMSNNLISILTFIFLLSGCDKVKLEGSKESDLELISSYELDLPEPSGLALSSDGKNLWAVSDNTGNIYLLSLDGKIVREINFPGKDLEGITVNDDNNLAVVRESSGEIILVDTEGNQLFIKKTDHKALEGIAYNKAGNRYYLVNEKSPSLFIELDENLEEINSINLDFSKDLSGITYEENEDVYWIISHESNLLAKLDSGFNLIEKYKIPLRQAEGVAVDYANKLIYMVSDVDNELSVFKMK